MKGSHVSALQTINLKGSMYGALQIMIGYECSVIWLLITQVKSFSYSTLIIISLVHIGEN